jgi:NAD(P)-dependent dehydrogenase (short-subunit alcohol dehydrogenase family)
MIEDSIMLQGRVAIVTGGASGIGAATAEVFAEHGIKVAITDIDEIKGQQVTRDIIAAGGDAIFIKHDVGDEKNWQEVVSQTLLAYKKLNILVNNAGISFGKMLWEYTLADFQKVLKINLESVFLGMKYASLAMVKNDPMGGSIVNVSSIAAITTLPEHSIYAASKAAVCSLTKSAALEYSRFNIRVNSVIPGPVETAIWEKDKAQFMGPTKDNDDLSQNEIQEVINQMRAAEGKKFVTSSTLVERIAKPVEIALLVSDISSFVTGIDFVIDGGAVLQRNIGAH